MKERHWQLRFFIDIRRNKALLKKLLMTWQYHKFAHSICKVFPEKLLMTSLYLYILPIYFPSVACSVSRTNNIILKRRVLLRSYRVGPKGLSALLNYIIDIDFLNPCDPYLWFEWWWWGEWWWWSLFCGLKNILEFSWNFAQV